MLGSMLGHYQSAGKRRTRLAVERLQCWAADETRIMNGSSLREMTSNRKFCNAVMEPMSPLLTVKTSPLMHDDGNYAVEVLLSQSKLNVLTSDLIDQLRRSIRDIEEDDKVKALILGSSMTTFCSGLDFNEMIGVQEEQFLNYWYKLEDLWKTLYLSPLVTCACIEGDALGVGAFLAIGCDFRVASRMNKVKIGFNDILFGIPTSRWQQECLQSTSGFHNAEVLLQTGLSMDVEGASSYKLIDFVSARDSDTWAEARMMLNMYTTVPDHARKAVKQQQRLNIGNLCDRDQKNGEAIWELIQQPECQKLLKEELLKRKRIKK